MWETVQEFIEKHHPSKAVAMRVMNLLKDNAMSFFCEILKMRQNIAVTPLVTMKVILTNN
jgi:hypothetical protein